MYPVTKGSLPLMGNNYVTKLIKYLKEEYIIINKNETGFGLLDMFFKMHKSDFIYFNWIEDLPDKRYGYLQIPVLCLIVMLSKIFRIKLIWFVHDNLSHTPRNVRWKKFITAIMGKYSDFIIAHTAISKYKSFNNFYCFDHPMDDFTPIIPQLPYKFDLLIWGKMFPYKGIAEFMEYNANSTHNNKYKVLLAGKFESQEYYEKVKKFAKENVTILNRAIPEPELIDLFSISKYILFTYNSKSVQSSAALCKTLSFGKDIIGPEIGSFRELGQKGLIFTYDSFGNLEKLLEVLENESLHIDQLKVKNYIEKTTWPQFLNFLIAVLK